MDEAFTIRVVPTDRNHALYVAGEIDVATAPQLQHELEAIIETSDVPAIRVDLADVSFMDSSGLHVLVAAHAALEKSGRTLFVSRPRPTQARLLELTGLMDKFSVTSEDDTPDQATGSGRSQA
jgi:anti-anti-sigma factor